MHRIYLDNNATTPVLPDVFEAMRPYFSEQFGNASSIHHHGQQTRAAVEDARESVAAFARLSRVGDRFHQRWHRGRQSCSLRHWQVPATTSSPRASSIMRCCMACRHLEEHGCGGNRSAGGRPQPG